VELAYDDTKPHIVIKQEIRRKSQMKSKEDKNKLNWEWGTPIIILGEKKEYRGIFLGWSSGNLYSVIVEGEKGNRLLNYWEFKKENKNEMS